jgi:hypothetical protein
MLQENTFDSDFVIVKMKYEVSNSIQVLVDGKIISPYVLSENVDLFTKTNICGANNFNPDNRTIEFVVNRNPNCMVRVRYIDSVKVNMRLTTTLEEFYQNNGVASFIDKMTSFLGIETSRMKIVNIRRGSVIIDFFIDSAAAHVDSDAAKTIDLNKYVAKISDAINSGSLPIEYPVTEFKTINLASPESATSSSPLSNSTSNKSIIILGNNSNSIIELMTSGSEGLNDATKIGLALGITIPVLSILFVIIVAICSRRNKLEAVKLNLDSSAGGATTVFKMTSKVYYFLKISIINY